LEFKVSHWYREIIIIMALRRAFRMAVDAAPSRGVNCFRMNFDGRVLLGTPAHVAIYPKNNRWVFSNFLKDFGLDKYDWKVPVGYMDGLNCENDFAYCDVDDNRGLTVMKMAPSRFEGPMPVSLVYRMLLDHDGEYHDCGSWGTVQTTLYDSISRPLTEAANVGYRGLSGAAAIDVETETCVGLFVRKGGLVRLKEAAGGVQSNNMGLFQSCLQKFMGISDIRQNMLRKDHIPELNQVFSVKRGIFLRSSQMKALLDEPCVHLRDLEGKRAPGDQNM
jgi:hypothetical protein